MTLCWLCRLCAGGGPCMYRQSIVSEVTKSLFKCILCPKISLSTVYFSMDSGIFKVLAENQFCFSATFHPLSRAWHKGHASPFAACLHRDLFLWIELRPQCRYRLVCKPGMSRVVSDVMCVLFMLSAKKTKRNTSCSNLFLYVAMPPFSSSPQGIDHWVFYIERG